MTELEEYRANLIQRLDDAAEAFREACLAATDLTAPQQSSDWSVHQIAVHTRDVNRLVYGTRARRTGLEDNPEFENFDGDAYMAEHYDPEEPLNNVLDGFVTSVKALADWLRELPDANWSRASRHATLGSGITLQSWVEKNLAHIEEHLKDVKKQSNQNA